AAAAKGLEHELAEAKAWQQTLYDAGWAGIDWPREHGGRGGSAIEAAIFQEEEAKVVAWDVVKMPYNVSMSMAGPVVAAFGTPEQKAEHLPAMLRGDELWCQLFSEPGAGSDLAALATRAE